MQQRIKDWIFTFLFVVLLLPVTQYYFPFVTSAPLNGAFIVAPDINFSWAKWTNGNYQDSVASYLNDNTGLRSDLIRFNNQVDYSLFSKVHSRWHIVQGKNNTAYQDLYIDAYTGRDYIGYDSIYTRMKKLRAIQDTLERLGKTFVLIHAPNKASFYPENIPDNMLSKRGATTNLFTYWHVGDSMGIHQLNFNTWFSAMKATSKELLYPRQGFHWSVYGAWLAADSMVKYLQHTQNIRMRRPLIGEISHTTKARDTDDDLVKGFNLILPVTTETFSYPEIKYPTDTLLKRPKIIFIGDSFLCTWMNSGFMDNITSSWQIWYYFRFLLDKDHRTPQQTYMGDLDWMTELNKADCIVLMYTSRNLPEMGDQFIERAYNRFYPNKK